MSNRAFAALFVLVASGAAGCGAGKQGPDFSACAGTPALIYEPGLARASDGGGFRATVTSARAEGQAGSPPDDAPAIGFNDWTIALTDEGGAPVTELTVTADKPRMPVHGHSASTFPTVTAQDGGVYVVGGIHFFMAGYWEVTLGLQPAAAAADRVAFPICVPE